MRMRRSSGRIAKKALSRYSNIADDPIVLESEEKTIGKHHKKKKKESEDKMKKKEKEKGNTGKVLIELESSSKKKRVRFKKKGLIVISESKSVENEKDKNCKNVTLGEKEESLIDSGGIELKKKKIVRHIESGKDEDSFEFRMNFVMLFVTVMIQCLKQGRLKEEILKYITAETEFQNIDWCDFIIENLKMLYVDSVECRKMKVDYTLNQITFWTMDRLRIRERLEIKGRGFGKGRFKGLTVSVNNQLAGEMEDISLEFQEEYTSVLKKLDDFEEKKKDIENELSRIYNRNIERSKVVSLMERHELVLQVKLVWPQDNRVQETTAKISDVLKKINEEIVDEEIHGVNENKMKDNNIEKLDIAVDLESDDNNYVNQVFQNETTEKGKDVEEGKIDVDKVPEVELTIDTHKEVEEIHQQIVKETNVHEGVRDVDLGESTKTVVDANNEATAEGEVRNVEDNDEPNYSLGLTQDGLILTVDAQIISGESAIRMDNEEKTKETGK
ncbi:hypothetical protein L1987_46928 [Smallanthus sonchifolius]|uniref:Uncharacterized protein n=1 Tax=Smallanthus sonchifolius TaxID=185202 RepID=A0ACB9G0T5_9ASTR|nr:hypothetical protein L1987_46928 [Smallanthus sonchifolius]